MNIEELTKTDLMYYLFFKGLHKKDVRLKFRLQGRGVVELEKREFRYDSFVLDYIFKDGSSGLTGVIQFDPRNILLVVNNQQDRREHIEQEIHSVGTILPTKGVGDVVEIELVQERICDIDAIIYVHEMVREMKIPKLWDEGLGLSEIPFIEYDKVSDLLGYLYDQDSTTLAYYTQLGFLLGYQQ